MSKHPSKSAERIPRTHAHETPRAVANDAAKLLPATRAERQTDYCSSPKCLLSPSESPLPHATTTHSSVWFADLGDDGKHGRDVVPVEVRRDKSPGAAPILPLLEKHGLLQAYLGRSPLERVLGGEGMTMRAG